MFNVIKQEYQSILGDFIGEEFICQTIEQANAIAFSELENIIAKYDAHPDYNCSSEWLTVHIEYVGPSTKIVLSKQRKTIAFVEIINNLESCTKL